ncbi:unnamed protein product [Didymodactylos carnosus]|uniref:Uncharacterized protein n=1 Tax=Didymodactylos carnosus TaxID=1234261 RepID=A0A815KAI6_9BILA|nr:unnamed protein product [Didymodactylos carnosus]CAF1388533.1 unnamed protein product [Didymodactylos carnosus]CAF4047592.1 unnamed protein product [Didymodactylos carnosus]CAF4283271.1 unnamed protein product [Didymodactylos carnosus]
MKLIMISSPDIRDVTNINGVEFVNGSVPVTKSIAITDNTPVIYRLYPRRFLILAIFCLCSLTNGFQWIEYVIIQNIIVRYYNESLPIEPHKANDMVTWTSLIYMVTYIPLVFPAMWLLDRKGLKITCSIGAFLNALGAIVKCASVNPSRWWVTFVGQFICAAAQSFTLGIPPYLAASWFGPDSVSTVTAIAVFGNQVGVALGSLIPSSFISDVNDLNLIGQQLRILYYSVATVCTIVFIAMVIFFRRVPPTPPSRAQAYALQTVQQNYGQALKRLLINKWFLLLLLSYGLNTGAFYSVSTLLNPIYLSYFKKQTESASRYAGIIGMLLIVGGIVGSVAGGFILDKTKAYNFFMTGYLPVGFEYGVEITYPENEAVSGGLLNVAAQVCGLSMTKLQEYLIFKREKVFISNIVLCIALAIGSVLTGLIRSPLRRQQAQKEPNALVDNQKEISL